jgi:alkylated DNA repair dioxygenase AlkB
MKFYKYFRYANGNDRIGEHRDDEEDLIPFHPIASISLGQQRDFRFRHVSLVSKTAKTLLTTPDPFNITLEHGSLLMMNSPTNTNWYHSLPIRKKILKPRINLTFRNMKQKKVE